MKPRLSVLTRLGFRTPGISGEELAYGAVVFIDLEGGLRLALWPSRLGYFQDPDRYLWEIV
jgi:hypothetical protein